MFEDRLCILDWGLVTNVNKELQVTLIEHVAHLVSKDYAAIPDDLVKVSERSGGGGLWKTRKYEPLRN